MVGCGGQWSSGPLNFQCCFSATRSCQAQGATWGIPAASTMFHRDGWGRGFVFSTGFSCNEHKLLWLECCYWPFMTCLHCCCICWSKVGYGRLKGYKFMNLQLFFFFPSGDEGCSTIASTLCTTSLLLSLSSSSKCTCHSGWNAPSGLPSTGCNLTLHC